MLFSGDGYSSEWVKEAEKRGLPNIHTFYESIKYFLEDKSVSLFERNGVFTKEEIDSRGYVFYEDYVSKKSIEAKTLVDMIRVLSTPAVREEIKALKEVDLECDKPVLEKLCKFVCTANCLTEKIDETLLKVKGIKDVKEKGDILLKEVVPLMSELREAYDNIEKYIAPSRLPYPTYRELFFDVE